MIKLLLVIVAAVVAMAAIVLAGQAAFLPDGMSINRRANQIAAGVFMLVIALAIALETFPTPQTERGSEICLLAIGLILAIFFRWAMVWRLKENVRDWESKYKHMWPSGPMAELMKNSLGVNASDAAQVIAEMHTPSGRRKVKTGR